MGKRDAVRVVVADANVLINLVHAGTLELLGRLPGYEFCVPAEVVREVTRPEQMLALRGALNAEQLREVAVAEPTAVRLFAQLRAVMGAGEAACLALAEARGWWVASDEKGVFRREANARLGAGRIVNTAGILLLAIDLGRINVEQADEIKRVLEQRRFRMGFGSFREIV